MGIVRILVILPIIIAIGVVMAILHTQRQAIILLADVSHLDAAQNPFLSFASFKEKHHHQLTYERCQADTCAWEFTVTNWPLAHLGLAPQAELRASISSFRQTLSTAGITYSSATFKTNSPIVYVQEDFCADRNDVTCDNFDLYPHGRDVAPAWNGSIEFGQFAGGLQKQAASGLNLSCFSAFHGCSNIAELIPKIWKLTGQGKVSSCLRSSSDSIAERNQPLSEACLRK